MVPNSNSPLVASPSSLSPVTHSLNGTACCEMGGKCAKRSQCGASKGRKGVTSSECLGRDVFWCQDHQITNEEVGMSGAQLVIHGYPLWFFKQSAGMINIWCSNQNHKKWISTKSSTRSHSWLQYQHSPTIRTASSTLLTKWRHPIRYRKKTADDAALSLILQNSTNLKNFYSLQTKQIRLSHSPSNKLMEVELPLCHLEVFFGPKNSRWISQRFHRASADWANVAPTSVAAPPAAAIEVPSVATTHLGDIYGYGKTRKRSRLKSSRFGTTVKWWRDWGMVKARWVIQRSCLPLFDWLRCHNVDNLRFPEAEHVPGQRRECRLNIPRSRWGAGPPHPQTPSNEYSRFLGPESFPVPSHMNSMTRNGMFQAELQVRFNIIKPCRMNL